MKRKNISSPTAPQYICGKNSSKEIKLPRKVSTKNLWFEIDFKINTHNKGGVRN